MTKTIKNITPRAVGGAVDVAYLSDLSAMNSDVAADIAYLSAIIGDFEGDSTIVRKGSDITQTLATIDSDLTTAQETIGYVIGDSTGDGYHVITSDTVYNNLLSLDDVVGEVPTDGQYITDQTASNVGIALAVLDNALAGVETSFHVLYRNITNTFGSQLHADDDIGWYMEFAGTYIGGISNVGDALEMLDSEVFDTVTKAGQLVEGMGAAYSAGMWDFTLLDPPTPIIQEVSTATDAFVALANAIESVQEARQVTLGSVAGSGNVATVYTIYQGGSAVGDINIPKDFLVKSAALSTVATADVPYAGAQVGDKYIDFVVNTRDGTDTAEHIYLPVNDLVDVYTAQQNAAQVQLAIDANNVISATIVAGSIGTTELADSAVTTAKIADANVTTAKIANNAVTTDKIGLVDTTDSSKVYTIQVTNGRLQLATVA